MKKKIETYNLIGKYQMFNDAELSLLKQQAQVSYKEICMTDKYTAEEVSIHSRLFKEIVNETIRRESGKVLNCHHREDLKEFLTNEARIEVFDMIRITLMDRHSTVQASEFNSHKEYMTYKKSLEDFVKMCNKLQKEMTR